MNATSAPDALDWDMLFREYFHRIRGFIRKRIHDLTDADDIASEVFSRAIAATKRGKGPRENPISWLFQIARNLVMDYYRACQRVPATIDLDAAVRDDDDDGYAPRAVADTIMAREPSPHELAEQAIIVERVRCAVGQLLDNQERVMTLRLDGYEFDEIAAEIDRSYNATKALQHRAYVQLQKHLEGVTA